MDPPGLEELSRWAQGSRIGVGNVLYLLFMVWTIKNLSALAFLHTKRGFDAHCYTFRLDCNGD